jgi:hypothetical protein
VHGVGRLFTAVAMQRNNRAAVFSLRSVLTTIGKLFRPMGNGVARQTLYQQATIPVNRNRRQCSLCGPFTGYIVMRPVQSASEYSASGVFGEWSIRRVEYSASGVFSE